MNSEELIGQFIDIPAWKTYGMIIEQESPMCGSEDAIRVRVQENPDQPAQDARWYHLEPGEYEIDGE